MKSGWLAWSALALWSAWGLAVQGAWTHQLGAGVWTPDLGVVLVIGLASRMTPERARLGAVVVALARVALTAEPVVAVLAAHLALAEFVALLRRSIDTEERWLRTTLAGFGAGAYHLWMGAVHTARSDTPADWTVGPLEAGLPVAVSTALLAALFGGWLRRLPGIGPLWKKEHPWGVAAHAR